MFEPTNNMQKIVTFRGGYFFAKFYWTYSTQCGIVTVYKKRKTEGEKGNAK